MEPSIPNLWPSFEEARTGRSPLPILKTQAEALTAATAGLLVGHVSNRISSDKQIYALSAIATNLRGYKYNILKVSHDISKIYPVDITDSESMVHQVSDESAFVDGIRRILRSPSVLEAIKSLMIQSRDADPDPDDFPF